MMIVAELRLRGYNSGWNISSVNPLSVRWMPSWHCWATTPAIKEDQVKTRISTVQFGTEDESLLKQEGASRVLTSNPVDVCGDPTFLHHLLLVLHPRVVHRQARARNSWSLSAIRNVGPQEVGDPRRPSVLMISNSQRRIRKRLLVLIWLFLSRTPCISAVSDTNPAVVKPTPPKFPLVSEVFRY